MHHSQAVRHMSLIHVCVGSNPTGVVCLTFIVDYHVLHFKVVLLTYTFLEIQLRVVQDHSERLTSYRGVKFNLSRFFPIFPQNIIAFFLDSRYRRYNHGEAATIGGVASTLLVRLLEKCRH